MRCKSARNLCGLDFCPLLAKIESSFPKLEVKGKDFSGTSPPSVFVGRYGYPKVNLSPLLPFRHLEEGEARGLDAPSDWYGKDLEEIIALRSQLYRVRTRHNVKPGGVGGVGGIGGEEKMLEAARSLALSARPLDVEVGLKRAITSSQSVKLDAFAQPMGPAVEPRRVDVVDNPLVPRRVDALVGDGDAPASTALEELFHTGISLEHITRLLSVGLLGQEHRRRMVPTRWSITAADDTIGKHLIPTVTDLPTVDKPRVYHADYIGNNIFILMLPRIWSFEMVETWMKGAFWASATRIMSDWEDYRGRKEYAGNITGAYYAARLAVLEHMLKKGKQATAVVYREITERYLAPLGVWVIRETARSALEQEGIGFETLDQALEYITKNVRAKPWAARSALIERYKVQSSLDDFV